jgi:hypothetical protein
MRSLSLLERVLPDLQALIFVLASSDGGKTGLENACHTVEALPFLLRLYYGQPYVRSS